jgi:hypothetical protein
MEGAASPLYKSLGRFEPLGACQASQEKLRPQEVRRELPRNYRTLFFPTPIKVESRELA